MEIFQWISVEESTRINDQSIKAHIAEELADVLIYYFSLSNQFTFNIVEIIKGKMEKKAKKYPAFKSEQIFPIV